jgi:integrase/recombinase XerD
MDANGLSSETQRHYSYALLRFIAENPWPLEQISEGHVMVFLASLGKRAAARQMYIRGIRSFFGWAVAREYIRSDPSALLKPRRQAEPDPDAYTEDEIQCLVLRAYARHPKRASAILACYGLGARRGELCRLQPEDVDFSNGVVHFRFTKGNKPRRVEMSRIAREALEELRPYWTDTVLGGIEPNTFSAWVHQAALECGFPADRRKGHMLRASYATHLINRGVPVSVVSKLLGHSDLKVTTRYAAVREDQRRDAVGRL